LGEIERSRKEQDNIAQLWVTGLAQNTGAKAQNYWQTSFPNGKKTGFMRTTLYIGIASLLLLRPGLAEDKPAATGKPQITFAEQTYDFQKVKVGEVVKHAFVFTNTGSATLNILDVKPGCGCTTAGTWDKTVEPGKTGSIPLQFDSKGFGGKVTKMATVISDDPGHSNTVLQITGTVWRPIDFTPTMAMFNMPPEGQTNETKTIRIVSNVDEPITLSDPECSNKAFKTELAVIKPGKEFDLKVTALPPFTNSYTSAPIKVKTSSKEMPELNATAYVTVLPAVQAMPQQVMLPAGPLASPTRPLITIRGNTDQKLELSEPKINVTGVEISLKESQPGKMYNISLGFPAGYQIPAGQYVEVSVKSNHPKYPLIKIPVTQAQNPVQSVANVKKVTGTVAR
jgi:hypothetical protein